MDRQREELRARFERDALPLIGRVLRAALHFTGNVRDADDLVQDTYKLAFERFAQFKEGTNLLGWLNRILYTRFVNLFHQDAKHRRMISLDRDIEPDAGPPSPDTASSPNLVALLLSSASRVHLDQRVWAAVDDLPTPMREVLVLCVIGEMKYREAAETLGIPIGTVMSRLSRAKIMMRELLASALPHEGSLQQGGRQ